MAKNKGWWLLELQGNIYEELSDADREHIASQIKEGFIEGEIVEDEE